MGFSIEQIQDLKTIDIEKLVEESEKEGFRFLSRLVKEYNDGKNTFSNPGEALFGVQDDAGHVIAIGGVNQSSFPDAEQAGRLRRFYVLPDARRQGAGSLLLKEIIDHARTSFKVLTVRTESSQADAFYLANGFDFDDSASETTHIKHLTK